MIFIGILCLFLFAVLAVIAITSVNLLLERLDCIMATLAEVNEKLDAVAAGVDGLEAMIVDLKKQVADGSAVTQADLDALFAKAESIGADISDTSDQG
jgi:hypothetical protein